jgi:hypothetical protein
MSLQLCFDLSVHSNSTVIGSVVPADTPCPRCSAARVTVGSSAGPHYARLNCTGCDLFRGWMPGGGYRECFTTGLSTHLPGGR